MPSARQHNFDLAFEQTSLTNFALKLKVSYEFRNPYKRDFPLPNHAMGIIFNNDRDVGTLEEIEATSIPAKSSEIIEYEFFLDFTTLQSLMGKNNEITFHTSIELDLSDFSDLLPKYQLNVSEDFNIETSKLKPMVDDLLKRRIGSYDLVLEHSTNIKIPALPTISPSSKPIEITLLGDGLDIADLGDIRDKIVPFTDVLINGEMANLTHPFISSVKELKSPIPPNPTLEQIMLDAINIVFPNLDFTDDWTNLAEIMAPADGKSEVSSYLLSNFINSDHLNNFTNTMWSNFTSAYDSIKDLQFPELIPGPETRGFEIAIPIVFHNNNEFSINVPVFRSTAFMSENSQPFSMYVKPEGISEIPLETVPSSTTILGNDEETLFIVFSFDMQAFNNGMYSIFMKKQFKPNLQGILSYDFGYGPMYVSYDLDQLELDYK